ncbi:MAG: segregation/condensation protein A [Christensenellaceae bacterium]
MEKITVESVKNFDSEVDYTTVLDNFEGPLDLLLHLIKEQEIEVKDIFVSQVTEQFLMYMKGLPYIDMDKASDYLNIAATIIDIRRAVSCRRLTTASTIITKRTTTRAI